MDRSFVKQVAIALGLAVMASPGWTDDESSKHGLRPLVGVSVGWPLGVNGVIGIETPQFGARVSGAYWGRDLSGVELALSALLFRASHSQMSVQTVIGTSRWDSWFESGPLQLTSYAGIGARVQWRGIFLSQGPCYRLNREHAPTGIGRRSRFIWHMAAGFVFALGG